MSSERCKNCKGSLGAYCNSIRPGSRERVEPPSWLSDETKNAIYYLSIGELVKRGCKLPIANLEEQFIETTPPSSSL